MGVRASHVQLDDPPHSVTLKKPQKAPPGILGGAFCMHTGTRFTGNQAAG